MIRTRPPGVEKMSLMCTPRVTVLHWMAHPIRVGRMNGQDERQARKESFHEAGVRCRAPDAEQNERRAAGCRRRTKSKCRWLYPVGADGRVDVNHDSGLICGSHLYYGHP